MIGKEANRGAPERTYTIRKNLNQTYSVRFRFLLAEKERFELSNRFTGYTISNRAPSTN